MYCWMGHYGPSMEMRRPATSSPSGAAEIETFAVVPEIVAGPPLPIAVPALFVSVTESAPPAHAAAIPVTWTAVTLPPTVVYTVPKSASHAETDAPPEPSVPPTPPRLAANDAAGPAKTAAAKIRMSARFRSGRLLAGG
jgi:hypothetical protein